jgi:hypothetical protein
LLQKPKLCSTKFLITDIDYENSVVTDSHQSPNVQAVYRHGKTLSKEDDNLSFQLLTDLAIHYKNLGLSIVLDKIHRQLLTCS